MTRNQKKVVYHLALKKIDSVLESESSIIAKMATINCLLKENIPYYIWTGFYLVNNNELLVGPYQGSLGCLHIAFGKGVCGISAKEQKTIVVKDVDKFPGHIACDSRSKSEIVVPVFTTKGKLIAVFDVDSVIKGSFDAVDKHYLETLFKKQFACSNVNLL